MDRDIKDFEVCDDTWEKIQEIEDLECHLLSVRRWFEASDKPDSDIIHAVATCQGIAETLFQRLVDLQIKLLTVL